ncbi:MAG: hypothetical protein IJP02_05100 [Oscillospiraceae bacterium]|nr:hypothetical protein [Oscillospiraceae bacterium]
MEKKTEILKPNEVVAPTLFVGVGGTGCKIVKKVAEKCAPEEKENINFLCLDTNVNDLNDVLNSKSKFYWVQTSNTQTVGSYLDFDEEARKKWFPKNSVMYDKTVSEGAGQVRAISRLALNSTIKTGRIRPLYDAIDELFRKTGREMKQAMRVVIASTASGGTGSGILLPLSMFIRDYVKEKYPNTSLIVRALILLPETLDSVIDSQTERDSQARNAYATIKELNAFMMKGSGFVDLDDDLKQFSDMHVNVSIAGSDNQKSLSLLPVDFCFLMDGQDAEDSTMISIAQYIEQAAQALYEQNIGPMQKKAFSVEDNIIKEMTKPGNYGRNRFGGIGAGVIRYPYEMVADYVAYDLALDSIGGEGDASKWTKYDKAIAAYKAEQKSRGVPMSTWDPDGKIYCDTLHNAKDPFSKDLNNTFELDGFDSRVKRFRKSFEDQVYRVVLADKRFNSVYNAAKQWESTPSFGESENKIADALDSLSAYRSVVEARSKDGSPIVEGIVTRWVESVMTNEQKTITINDTYSIESLLKNAQGEIFHPCAVRYALYRLMDEFDKEVRSTKHLRAEESIETFKSKEYEFKFTNEKVFGIESLGELEKEPGLIDKLKGYKKLNEEANQDIPAYFMALEDYCKKVAVHAAYAKAYAYVKAFSEQFEQFFSTFVYKVKDLSRQKIDLVDLLAYKKGDSFVNICATEELLQEVSSFSLQKVQKETSMLSSDINGSIFDAVKRNAIFKMELDNSGGYIEEDRRVNIFDDILMGYFRDSVREKCDDIDRDIIGAIELEQNLKNRIRQRRENGGEFQAGGQSSQSDIERHIREVVEMGGRIAAPSVQRVTNEEPREIKVCAYNRSLLDNRKYRVKDLMPNGEAVDTVSKYEIRFYNALYNVTPDKLKKFAAPFETETGKKSAGTYHKAYSEYARLIGPDSTKNAAISTHIDKAWDSIKSMPELDFNYQQQVIQKVHKAFVYGLIHHAIQQRPLSAVANGKKVFLYRDSTNRDVELVVPNGTLCDEFYEVLDALYVNAKVVEDIGLIKGRKRAVSEAKNCNYEDTEFFRDMAGFNLLKLLDDDAENKNYDGTQSSLDELKKKLTENKKARSDREAAKKRHRNQRWDPSEMEHDGEIYVENPTSLFAIPLMFYCTLPNSGRYVSEITAMVDAVIDVFREEYSKWEKPEDVKFVLCTRLTDELNLLKKNYSKYRDYLNAPEPHENIVIDIIQRKIRDVIMSAPEPEDYEALLDQVAKEFSKSNH